MTIQKTLIANAKFVCIAVGSVVISYSVATLIAWAGVQYYGDIETFMAAFRAAGNYLAVLRILIYSGLIYAWVRLKRRALLHSDSPERTKRSARRIEFCFAAVLMLTELMAWQFNADGGAL